MRSDKYCDALGNGCFSSTTLLTNKPFFTSLRENGMTNLPHKPVGLSEWPSTIICNGLDSHLRPLTPEAITSTYIRYVDAASAADITFNASGTYNDGHGSIQENCVDTTNGSIQSLCTINRCIW
jgi:hypothetical protein